MTEDAKAPEFDAVLNSVDSFPGKITKVMAVWKHYPLGIAGLLIIVVVIVAAVLATVVAPYSPYEFVGPPLQSPSAEFLLGTNHLGQDVLSRIIHGAQVSVAVGFSAAIIAATVGTTLGIISGYFGGWVDVLIQRGLEVLASFPGLVLALAMVVALGQPRESGSNVFLLVWQLRTLELAIALVFIFANSRIIRSVVLMERSLPYIEAATSIGCSTPRILARHILPNVLPYAIVSFSTIIGLVILIEAALSFLGYGVSATTASWGIDLANRNRDYFLGAPWLVFGPGAALSLTVLAFNFLGDSLRDMLDPRLRGSR